MTLLLRLAMYPPHRRAAPFLFCFPVPLVVSSFLPPRLWYFPSYSLPPFSSSSSSFSFPHLRTRRAAKERHLVLSRHGQHSPQRGTTQSIRVLTRSPCSRQNLKYGSLGLFKTRQATPQHPVSIKVQALSSVLALPHAGYQVCVS
ncbi:hypothetical protein DFH07DRAFT_341635 [Mycena maculata]|uniref:Uncharacterized protein n=1 Tax=Mycena maculata TaxID=230809 RepID=A0AAD7MIC6_9AGAR|nr:hypothetical protein DFH07DRAFT_341635 [Mycena maculata]